MSPMITMGWAVRQLDGPATSVNATPVHPRRSMRALARAGRNWGQDARLVSASNHFQMPYPCPLASFFAWKAWAS